MRPPRNAGVALLARVLPLVLAACMATGGPAPPYPPPPDPPARDIFAIPELRDSVYLPVDRTAPPPAGYGLYSVLLTRAANANTLQLLSILFTTTSISGDAALARANLNLITIPVKKAQESARALASARSRPGASAAALMQDAYDFGQAEKLMASVCHPLRGAAVMSACGSRSPEGPLLVTALRPVDGAPARDQPLLIVNLSATPAEAVPEVLAAYRRQILRSEFSDRSEFGWRLWALNHILDTSKILPTISKAYANSK